MLKHVGGGWYSVKVERNLLCSSLDSSRWERLSIGEFDLDGSSGASPICIVCLIELFVGFMGGRAN